MSIPDDLERLAELHRQGVLNDAEFINAKARTLGAGAGPSPHPDVIYSALHGLRRSRTDNWLGGVCGGLGQTTGLPSWIWRLIFISLVLCAGTGLMLYLVLWVLLPKDQNVIDVGPSSYRPG